MKKRTIIDLFEESVARYPDSTLLLEKVENKFIPTTYSQAKLIAEQIGAGLCSIGFGKGCHASILSEGRNLWILGELGLFYAGGINVPISIKIEESNDLLFRFNHAEVDTIMVSGRQLQKVRAIRSQLEYLKRIIVFDRLEQYEEGEIFIDDVIASGKIYLEENYVQFKSISQSIDNNDKLYSPICMFFHNIS